MLTAATDSRRRCLAIGCGRIADEGGMFCEWHELEVFVRELLLEGSWFAFQPLH